MASVGESERAISCRSSRCALDRLCHCQCLRRGPRREPDVRGRRKPAGGSEAGPPNVAYGDNFGGFIRGKFCIEVSARAGRSSPWQSPNARNTTAKN